MTATTTSAVEIHVADLVAPVTSPPIVDGAVAVANGLIVAVGTERDILATQPNAVVTRWPGLITPGLVNAHTHLQYTSFAAVGAQPYENYTDWSIRFNEEYAARQHDDWTIAYRAGAEQMVRNGITAIGDIVTDFECRDILHDLDIPGVAYLELIGIDLDDWNNGVGTGLRQAVLDGATSPSNRVGISPHAPYSIDAPVLTKMADLARELDVRLHIHVAESDGEDELYRTGTGSLADRLRIVSTRRVALLENGGAGLGAAAFVQSLGVLGPTCHVAHGVYLGSDGRAIMAADQTLVALCPRSNLIVGVDSPPVADFLREAVPFAIGTDSLTSSPSLDLLDDVAELHRLATASGMAPPDLSHRLLRAATLHGAQALGLDHSLGSLEVGKRADLAVFGVTSIDELTQSGAGRCRGTIIAGEIRHRIVGAPPPRPRRPATLRPIPDQ